MPRRDGTTFPTMTWEVGQIYEIEASTYEGPPTLTYVGEINLEWTFENVHVFRTQDGSLIGLRNEDIKSARTAS